jgi:hypothetical protein
MNGTTKYPITAEQYYNETYGGDNAKGNSWVWQYWRG